MGIVLLAACENDDTLPDSPLTGEVIVFTLGGIDNSGISGTASFAKREDNATVITINLSGTSAGNSHPTHIHFNSAAEEGDIALSLSPVDVESGRSRTIVNVLDNGTTIGYDELINFDGYINVHNSANDLTNILAQGDIGQNVLTGNSMTYDLNPVSNPDIMGSVTFAERINGETLISVNLLNDNSATQRPGHIHMNTAAEGGEIAVRLSPTIAGKGMTNVAMLEDETAITYSQLIAFDGYINIHASISNISTFVAQGDIGQNALTGEMKSYTLTEKDVDGVNGTFTLYERMNGETLAIIALEGTTAGDMHPGHIHQNATAEGGNILLTLNPVNGETGLSMSNLSTLDNGMAISFADILNLDAHINIHNSANDLITLIAQGDIGINVD